MEKFTVDDITTMDIDDLEILFSKQNDHELKLPGSAIYKGQYLLRIDSDGAGKWYNRYPQELMFNFVPFGLNFFNDKKKKYASGDWYFFHRRLCAGSFEMIPGQSRWRNTNSIALNYDNSSLPSIIKNILYDEIKYIGNNIYLGIGGVNKETGNGDHFYFVISPAYLF